MKLFSLIMGLIYLLIHIADYKGIQGSWFVPITTFFYIVINVAYLYKYRKNQLICFELFFAISFYLCSFLTPYIFPYINSFSGRIFIDTPYNQVKVYGVSFIGYCLYFYGLLSYNNKNINKDLRFDISFNMKSIAYSNILCLFFIFVFYITGGSRLLTLYSDSASNLNQRFGVWGEYMNYAMYAYMITTVITFMNLKGKIFNLNSLFKNIPLLYYINTILLVLPLLISGLRSSTVQLLIPMLMMYGIAIKQLKPFKVLGIILIGYIVMLFIGMTRLGDTSIQNNNTNISYFLDFIPANGANSFFIDYVDNNGFTGGSNMLMQLISIIPFMQSFVLIFIDHNDLAPVSSAFFTDSFMNSTQGGLGTGLIGDIYYSFGFIGILLLMFVLGLLVRLLSNNKKSPYSLVMSMVLSGNAFFAPRVEYCFILRSLAYVSILMWFILKISRKKYL